MLKRVLTVFLLMAPVLEAFADPGLGMSGSLGDIFTPSPLDLSINYLRMIFGTVGNVLIGGGDELIAQLFGIFNAGLLVFVGGFVSYTVFRSVINTSQDGSMSGQGKGGNAWTVFRIVLGVSLLVPMYQGYSMAQVTVMWAVKQGIGLADTMWAHTADHLSQRGGAVMSPPVSKLYDDLRELAAPKKTVVSMQNLMQSAACLAVLDKSGREAIAKYQRSATGQFSPAFTPMVRVGAACKNGDQSKSHICFGTESSPAVCGSYSWTQDELKSVEAPVQVALLGAAENYLYIMKNIYDKAGKFYESASLGGASKFKKALNPNPQCTGSNQEGCQRNKQALASFSCSPLADATSSNFAEECLPGIALVSGATHYYSAIKPARVNPNTQASGQDKQGYTEQEQQAWADQAKAGGWITAGQSYHHMISQPNQPPTQLKDLNLYRFTQDQTGNSINFSELTFSGAEQINNPTCQIENLNKNTEKLMFKLGNDAALTAALGMQSGQYTLPEKGRFVICSIFSQLANQYQQHAQHKISTMKQSSLFGRLDQSDASAPAKGSTLDNVNQLTKKALNMLMKTMNQSFTQGAFEGKAAQTIMGISPFGNQPLGIAPQNIKTMLTLIVSDLLGIQPYTAENHDLSALYNDGDKNSKGQVFSVTQNPDCISAKKTCNSKAGENICFQTATKSCIQAGEGILGSMYSAKQGAPVDQVLLITNLGLSMINNAVEYWTSTINGIYLITKAITKNLTNWVLVTGSVGALAGAGAKAAGDAMGASIIGTGAGMAMSAAGAIVNMASQIGIALAQMYYKFDIASLSVYLPFGASLAAAFFGMGITLGIYVPLIPFLTFLFSAIGWLIAVIEAMIAAPLVALGVTHPEGHDLLGKAEQSVMLLLGIFVRPAAMLLGFIMAVTLSYVAMEMLNIGFISVMLNYLSEAADMPQMIGFCGILLVYTYVAVSVIQQTFSMIYQVPEKLLRWIGVQDAPMGVAQMMQEVKGGASQAGGQAAGGASQAASSAPQMQPAQGVQAPQTGNMMKPKKEEGKAEADTAGGGDTGGTPPPTGP